ncbi:MAG: ribonuclease R [Xanthomonadales bacterium]|nr:ribonuclease R [Xanthomonadales bacterium]
MVPRRNHPKDRKPSRKGGRKGKGEREHPRDRGRGKGRRHRDDSLEIPGRDMILSALNDHGRPLTRARLEESLQVPEGPESEAFQGRLRAMERDGQLVRNRKGAYGLADRMDLVRGRIQAHRDGFGFVIPDTGGEDLFLPPTMMQRVMHGDRVLAAVTAVDRSGRREGMVVEVLERAHETVVGRFVEMKGIARVVPDDPKIVQDVLIPPGASGKATPGQIVVAAITEPPAERQPAMGRIVEVLGEEGAPGMATEIAIRSFGLPHEFPKEVERAAEAFGDTVPQDMIEGRRDFRDMPLVTIDGADARDFDDAVYAKRTRSGWQLVVAIADVASYVKPGEPLDDEARKRGTSVYFPARVLPMLPEALSNGLCSLRPDEDRLCVACEMTLDAKGAVTRSRFVAGVMRSQARLTYRQVQRHIDGDDNALPDDQQVRETVDALHGVYLALRAARERRGAIDFESTEVAFRFGEDGHVSDVVPVETGPAHQLIEECMILANVQAANLLLEIGLPAPFRVHEPPPETKLEPLTEFLRGRGFKISWKDEPEPRDFEAIVEQARGRDDEHLVMAMLLRSQSLAVYQPANAGHFGLALEAYTHFTSPIRRYPDLLVHRAIHHHIARRPKREFPHSKDQMVQLCESSSHTSRRAEEASRDVAERLKCYFLLDHVGDEFDGLVTGVTSFGVFVQLERARADGLVHITALPNDYYHFDPVAHRLTGERSGRVVQLADKVRVRVVAVSPQDRKIDLEWVEQ